MNKFLVMVAGLLLACSARAESYLYWMLDDVTDSRLGFAYAMIASEDADGNIEHHMISVSGNLVDNLESNWFETGSDPDYLGTGLTGGPYYALLPENSIGRSFFIELYNWEDQVVGVSDYATFEQLDELHHIYENLGQEGIVPYHFSASVPEPSCGLLVLFGLGLLGLKRRERGERRVEV